MPNAGLDTRKEFVPPEISMVKGWRQELDVILQQLKSAVPSRERSLSITKIQEAIMWLGMDLKRQAEPSCPSPYPQSYNPASARIEPTADGLKM